MFHCFGCMCSFLLSVVWCEDINDGHEIDLLLGGTWRGNKQGGRGGSINLQAGDPDRSLSLWIREKKNGYWNPQKLSSLFKIIIIEKKLLLLIPERVQERQTSM